MLAGEWKPFRLGCSQRVEQIRQHLISPCAPAAPRFLLPLCLHVAKSSSTCRMGSTLNRRIKAFLILALFALLHCGWSPGFVGQAPSASVVLQHAIAATPDDHDVALPDERASKSAHRHAGDFMQRLRTLAREALSWAHIGSRQRLISAAVLTLDAVPVQEMPPWFFEQRNLTKRDIDIDLISLDSTKTILCNYVDDACSISRRLRRFIRISRSVFNAGSCVLLSCESPRLPGDAIKFLETPCASQRVFTQRMIDSLTSETLHAPKEDASISARCVLWPCQESCLQACETGARIIEMACGCGKSRVMQELADRARGRVLIVVPSHLLMQQFAEIFPSACRVGMGYNDKIVWNSNIFISVRDSVHLLSNLSFAQIYIDEAHHPLPADLPDGADIYYFSATHHDQADFQYTMGQAIDDGILCDYDVTIPIVTHRDEHFCLANLLRQHAGRFSRVLAYCNSIADAHRFRTMLEAAGLAAWHMNGDTRPEVRSEIIADFAGLLQKPVHILVTVQVLGEGVNIPSADTCLFVEPRSSYVSIVQAIGRVLRQHPSKPLAHLIFPAVTSIWGSRVRPERIEHPSKSYQEQISKQDVGSNRSLRGEGAHALVNKDATLNYKQDFVMDSEHPQASAKIKTLGYPGYQLKTEDGAQAAKLKQAAASQQHSLSMETSHRPFESVETQSFPAAAPSVSSLYPNTAQRSKGQIDELLRAKNAQAAVADDKLAEVDRQLYPDPRLHRQENENLSQVYVLAGQAADEQLYQSDILLSRSLAQDHQSLHAHASNMASSWSKDTPGRTVERSKSDNGQYLAGLELHASHEMAPHASEDLHVANKAAMTHAELEGNSKDKPFISEQRDAHLISTGATGEGQLHRFMRALAMADHRFKQSLQENRRGRLCFIDVRHGEELASSHWHIMRSVMASVTSMMNSQRKWEARLCDVNRFVLQEQRLPRQKADNFTERSLSHWLRNEASRFKKCLYTTYQIQAYQRSHPLVRKMLPRFLDPDHRFKERCKHLKTWICKFGALPTKNGDQNSRLLSNFLSNQLKNVGGMSKQRREALRSTHLLVAQKMDSGLCDKLAAWHATCSELANFIHEAGRVPKPSSNHDRENALHKWLNYQANKRAKLTAEQVQLLRGMHSSLAQRVDAWSDPFLKWRKRAEQLDEFVKLHGHLPKFIKHDKVQNNLASWFSRQYLRKSILSGEQLAYFRKSHALIRTKLADQDVIKRRASKLLKNHKQLCDTLSKFIKRHSRFPSVQAGGIEGNLYASFHNHVQRLLSSTLGAQHKADLRSLHPKAVALMNKWADPLAPWKQRCSELEGFLAEHQRLPRSSGATREERRLAGWLHQQMSQLPSLGDDRVSSLRRLHVTVSERVDRVLDPLLAWKKRLQDCSTFIKNRGRLPRYSSSDKNQTSLYNWLIVEQKRAFINQRLSTQQRRELQALHPALAQKISQWSHFES
eukprot:TRINITY_DN11894_c0_g3_i1.p1 TRINITY_DN11894_c0_g3~~TRINITY_DN11894_c0_g3_i1.p1  ORF type:complete len:1448 (+),score=185.85 TRINITY_DN11894_c0_g3_i1:104-4447(+)